MIPFILAAVGGYLIGDSIKSDATKMADGGVMEELMESVAKKIKANKGFEVEYIGFSKKPMQELLDVTVFLGENGYDEIVRFKIKIDKDYQGKYTGLHHCVSAYYYNGENDVKVNFSKEDSQKLFGIAEYTMYEIEDEILEKANNAYDMAASYERDDSQDR